MRKSWKFLLLCVALVTLQNPVAYAAGFSKNDVPGPLQDWIPWVLHGQEEQTCAFRHDDAKARYCAWPSRLSLRLRPDAGEFSQEWDLQIENWVTLPGDRFIWPRGVLVDQSPVSVVFRNDRPAIKLTAGAHTVTGSFSWKKMPETLPLPPATGLLDLSVNGGKIDFPDIDLQGNLWLRGRGGSGDAGKNRLTLKVFRHISDSIPLMITTRIELDVSGTPREVLLAKPVPDEYFPLGLSGPLPVRLEPDGRLRVQVRPGRWTITLTARHQGPVNEIKMPGATDPWPVDEIWVFESHNDLRMVSVTGVEVVDPTQTSLPAEWRHLPAYRVKQGDTLKLIAKKRGDPDPEPDSLSLSRTIWLDEAGHGVTIHDFVAGTISKGWRLEMPAPVKLGRVTVDGRDQLITRVDGSRSLGVEVRRGHLNLTADSRIDGTISSLPAVGWAHDFKQVKALLNLPPGWRLLDASGVDNAPTWLNNWTLLDLFLVLVIALASARLFGGLWGAAALLALTLTYHEPDAPRWIWLYLLAATAIVKALPEGRAAAWFAGIRLLLLLFLLILSIPFMVQQVRLAIFPQLETPYAFRAAVVSEKPVFAPAPDMETAGEISDNVFIGGPQKKLFQQQPLAPATANNARGKGMKLGKVSGSQYFGAVQEAGLLQYDPRALIQTGPGLPQWSWRSIPLRWNGPVTSGQRIRLILLSPAVNMLLGFARVGLLALLIFCFFNGVPFKKGGFGIPWPGKKIWAGALMVFSLLAGAAPGRAEMPPNELLDELRQRLLATEDCLPECADIARLGLEIDQKRLDVSLDIQAYAEVAVPLPGNRQEWTPQRVTVDGKSAAGLFNDKSGTLLLLVHPGRHNVVLSGPLPGRNTVRVDLPLKPHDVQVKSEGWSVEGVHENGLVDDRLQLTRIPGKETPVTPAVSDLPPFVRVERVLHLGLDWSVETKVTRMSPPGTPIILAVPLLDGESVTSAHMHVEDNRALINMGPFASGAKWRSVFKKRDRFILTAPETTAWTEVWRLDAGPVWHVTFEGIPVIHHQDKGGAWQPEWRPWPGESVALTISRPQGADGRTVTIDDGVLTVNPGLRATEVNLALTMRSSRGDQHTIRLPGDAVLQKVTLNGRTQPIRAQNQTVTVPLIPGTQKIGLAWIQEGGVPVLFRTPEVDLGMAGVNTTTRVHMPVNRWTLFLGGPRTGPAVLFWGELIIILLIAVVLGRVRITPLKTYQWLLLAVGLSQVDVVAGLLVAGWLLALGFRERYREGLDNDNTFNAVQIMLAILTITALAALFHAIERGLLGHPEMQIAGNGSTAYDLIWYQDRTGDTPPGSWVLSVPLSVYRAAMLAWALWLSFALIQWLRWGWGCFSADGLWRKTRFGEKRKKGAKENS